MRNLFFTLILIFISCAFVLAQEVSPCPKIEVTGPSGATTSGDTMTFTVNIFDTSGNYKFDWSISNGNIIEGQGTPVIRVSTARVEDGEIKATVQITGLPKDCNNQASEIGNIRYHIHPSLIDEYGKLSFAKEKARLNQVAKDFKKFDKVQMIIIFYNPKNSIRAFRTRQSNIKKYLINTLKIPEDRFEFIFGGNDSSKTQIFLQYVGK